MAAPTLTPPPQAPSIADPATFPARANAHVAWQTVNVSEMESVLAYIDAIAVAAGPAQFKAGSRVNPSIVREGGTAGIFFPTLNQFAIATAEGDRFRIDENGHIRIPQDNASTLSSNDPRMDIRADRLGTFGASGLRFRMSGTGGTNGVLQITAADGSWLGFDPSRRLIASDDVLDIRPLGAVGLRLGHLSGSASRIALMAPGTATERIVLAGGDGVGTITAGRVLSPLTNDTQPALAAVGETNTGFGFNQSIGIYRPRVLIQGSQAARYDPAGTSVPVATTVITREKGDARYQQQASSVRYKDDIEDAEPADLSALSLKHWTWGGELAEDDQKRGLAGFGLIAEDVAAIIPEAVTRDAEGRPDGLDALALIGHIIGHFTAEIAALKARMAEMESS